MKIDQLNQLLCSWQTYSVNLSDIISGAYSPTRQHAPRISNLGTNRLIDQLISMDRNDIRPDSNPDPSGYSKPLTK